MKRNIFLCFGLAVLMLLSSCNQTPPPADDPQTDSGITEETLVADTSVEIPPEVPTEPETEAWETISPVEDKDVDATEVEVKAVGELRIAVSELTQHTDKGKTHVRVIPSLGYACKGFIYDNVKYAGDILPLSLLQKDSSVVLCVDYATYELPIVNVSVGGRAIESKTDYVAMTFSMENTEDLMVGVYGGIRLRGNSTAQMPKPPYRIKFAQKQSLFGLEKAKDWVLLAEYLDPSCLHNYAAMYLGAASDELAFTPTIHHVNLYLDGTYMGLYSLCEQVEVNAGRLGIETEITADMRELTDFSFLVCMDELAPEEDDPYFFLPSVGRYFQLKYPKREDFASTKQFNRFMTQLEDYYSDMASAFVSGNNTWIKKNIHTGSLIDHLVVDQIMGEKDHVWKSFYSYHNAEDEDLKGKICFGPIWDYDYSLYMPWTGEPNESYDVDTSVDYSNFFFQGLMRSRYANKVGSRYEQYYAKVLDELIPHLEAYHDSIEASLALNQARWYTYDADLTEDNFKFMIRFFKSRQRVLEKAWG